MHTYLIYCHHLCHLCDSYNTERIPSVFSTVFCLNIILISLTTPSFVGTVRTIDASVAEVQGWKTRAISASQAFLVALTIPEQRFDWLSVYEKLLKFHITIRHSKGDQC